MTTKVTTPTDTQIVITRELDAPKELVWRAYTTPELVKRWWAGSRGEVTAVEIDLTVGGTWRYEMTAGPGLIAFHGVYRDIDAPHRLVNTESMEGVPGEPALVTVTLIETLGRTSFRMTVDCTDRAQRDMIVNSGMEDGLEETYALLEKVALS